MLYHLSIRCATAVVFGLAIAASPATAQSDRETAEVRGDGAIVVTAEGIGRLDFLAGTSVLEGAALRRNLDGQIGAVLETLPGVSATGFAPGASRPVLRGLQGERVRILVNGLGALDASNTSTDHAVSVDPLTAARIDVLRGPATLLYGSSAIGGAVNIIQRRIPLAMPEAGVRTDALGSVDNATRLREAGAAGDFAVARTLAAHVDASWRKTDDIGVANYVLAPKLRHALLGTAGAVQANDPEEAAELRDEAGRKGRVPSTATETASFGTGIAWIDDGANLGLSAGLYDTHYGVPERPGGNHADDSVHEDGSAPVAIDLRQWRADLHGGVEFAGGPFARLTTRWGYSNYTHTEFEGRQAATRFDVEGVEGRVELTQREQERLNGTIGGQFYHRTFRATGEEAYIAANRTNQAALFVLEEWNPGPIGLEFAGRYEHTRAEADGYPARTFGTLSGAAGLWREMAGGLRFGLNASRAERAPSAEELFANGAHAATQQYEIGDPALDSETAWGVEIYLHGKIGPGSFAMTAYKTWFSNYIYLEPSGNEIDGLPVHRQKQADARYKGFEAELSLPLARTGGLAFGTVLAASAVRANLANGTPLPRIPPLTLSGALTAESPALDARVELEWVGAQDRVAPLETPTDSFALVGASLAWRPFPIRPQISLLLDAENLFDAVARNHASLTKDYVPLTGRNVKISVRWTG